MVEDDKKTKFMTSRCVDDVVGNYPELKGVISALNEVFQGKSGIASVLLRGSLATNQYIPGKSDIDLSIILDKYDFKKIRSTNLSIKNISATNKIPISVTYTDVPELSRDMELGMHFHGSKNSNYNLEIGKCSVTLYGTDMREYFLACQSVNLERIYFDLSKNITDFINRSTSDLFEAYKKGINYAFIGAKQILMYKGIFEVDKSAIVEHMKSITPELGSTLEEAYADSKRIHSIMVDEEKSDRMFRLLTYYKGYIGKELRRDEKYD